MDSEMTATQIREWMAGEDDEGRRIGNPVVEVPGYDIGRDLIAGLAILRAWGELSIGTGHEVLNVEVHGIEGVALANKMGRDTLRALAGFGWGFDDEIDCFYHFV